MPIAKDYDEGDQRPSWAGEVTFSDRGPWALTPERVLIKGSAEQANRAVEQLARTHRVVATGLERVIDDMFYVMGIPAEIDVELVVDLLADLGIDAEPDHVLFLHGYGQCGCSGCGDPCGSSANPVYAKPVYAKPVYAKPVYAKPVYAKPVYAKSSSPVWGSPVWATDDSSTPYREHGDRPSTARPAVDPARPAVPLADPGALSVFVVDTGLARDAQLPAMLGALAGTPADQREDADNDGDGWLDPAAGHGTFIAGIIEQLAPGVPVKTVKAVSPLGATSVLDLVLKLEAIRPAVDAKSIINMSFGGYAEREMRLLGSAIRRLRLKGAAIVASAGNDGICVPSYPAAFPGVVGVASVDSTGPAPYSNFGPWVRACAPGTDVVSAFFADFDGPGLEVGGADPDHFKSWARWSGTSFSAPIVSAMLARHVVETGDAATVAVERLIDAPGLIRIPDYGTVVNQTLT